MTEQTFEITVGIPASGKSHYAIKRRHYDINPKTYVSERDEIRSEHFCKFGDLNNYKFSKAKEKKVTEIQEDLIRKAISRGFNVIVSDTNLNKSTRDRLEQLSRLLGIEPTYKLFKTPLATCIKRNAKRHHTVPESVLIRMQKKMREYCGEFVQGENVDCLTEVVIFDIDGTLAKMNGRSPFEWHRVYEDLPRREVVNYNKLLTRANQRVIVLSGRDSVCRLETERWLIDNGVGYAELFMRPEGDNNPDWQIKEELFDKHIKGRYYVSHIVDDRKMMVEHWQSMGFSVFDVGNGISDF